MMRMSRIDCQWFLAIIVSAVMLTGLAGSAAGAARAPAAGGADLAALKSYLTEHTTNLVAGANDLNTIAQHYYDLALSANFDYQVLWNTHGADLAPMLEGARHLVRRRAWQL